LRYQNGFDKKEINFKYPLQVNWVFLIRCTSTHVLCIFENGCGFEFHTTKRLLEYFNDKHNCRGGGTLKVHLLWTSMKQSTHDMKRLLSTILCFDIFSEFLRNICMKICFLVFFFWERTIQRRCINHNTLLPFGNILNHFIIIKLHLLRALYRHFTNKPTTGSVLLEGI
jgi:hypothetical protein